MSLKNYDDAKEAYLDTTAEMEYKHWTLQECGGVDLVVGRSGQTRGAVQRGRRHSPYQACPVDSCHNIILFTLPWK
jgi:hypothetical protein